MSDEVIRSALPDTGVTSLAAPASGRPVPEARWARRYVLGRRLTDLAALVVAAGVVPAIGAVWPQAVGLPDRVKFAVICAVVIGWFLALRVGRSSETRLVVTERREYRETVARSLAVFAALALIEVAIVHIPGIRWLVLVTLPVGIVLLVGGRAVWRARLRAHRALGTHLARAVIVGPSRDVEAVAHTLASGDRAWTTVAVVLTDASPAGAEHQGGQLTFAGIDAVADAVAASGADTVVLAGQPGDGGVLVRDLAWRLETTRAELVLATSLEGVSARRLDFQPVDGLSMVHISTPVFSGGKHHLKRLTDIVLAAAALIVLAPAMAVIAVLVRLDSAGPVLFRQTRVGRDGTRFAMFKFRSMRDGADLDHETLHSANDGNGMLFKLRVDPRVTRVGAVLRRFSLDELPQIWNVLRGDMSLVGPRPPLPHEVERYDGRAQRRLFIKPGLTGLWQVSGRSDLDWETSVRLDLFYVANWSPFGDLLIMARTVGVILRPDGAY